MPIRPVGSERHHHVGLDASDVPGDGRHDLDRIRPIEVLVEIVEKRDLTQTPRGAGVSTFHLSDACERGPAGMPMIVLRIAAEAPGIAARGREQEGLDPFRPVPRKRAAHPEGLVIGVGKNGHQSRSAHRHRTPLLFAFSWRALTSYGTPTQDTA
jgi:hypothetical protein